MIKRGGKMIRCNGTATGLFGSAMHFHKNGTEYESTLEKHRKRTNLQSGEQGLLKQLSARDRASPSSRKLLLA